MVEATNKASQYVFGGLPKVYLTIEYQEIDVSRFVKWSMLKEYLENEYNEEIVAKIMMAKFEYVEIGQHFVVEVDDGFIDVYIWRK